MNAAAVLTFLKSVLPTKKIAAWILGVIGLLVAGVMGVANSDLKAQYCASEAVTLPATVAPAPVVAPAVEVK